MHLTVGNYMIRGWCETDALSLQKYANNRKIWINLRDVFPHPYTIDHARGWIDHATQESLQSSFAIATSEEVIGSIGFTFGEDINRYNAELGYWLAEPFWGHGIMTMVVRAFTEYAFKEFSINRTYAEPFANNQGSVRVLEKAGFVKEGVLRQSAVKDGALLDQVVFAMLKEETKQQIHLKS